MGVALFMCAEQGRKSPSCWISRLRILQFDPVAEGSELPDGTPIEIKP